MWISLWMSLRWNKKHFSSIFKGYHWKANKKTFLEGESPTLTLTFQTFKLFKFRKKNPRIKWINSSKLTWKTSQCKSSNFCGLQICLSAWENYLLIITILANNVAITPSIIKKSLKTLIYLSLSMLLFYTMIFKLFFLHYLSFWTVRLTTEKQSK